MLQHAKQLLSVLLKTVSIITLLNALVLYWIPMYVPLSSFFAIKLSFIAFVENRYYLIPISILICILLFSAALSIDRQRILCTTLSLIYLVCDFIMLYPLLIEGLCARDSFAWIYLIQTILDVTLAILICIYCWFYLRQKLLRRHN